MERRTFLKTGAAAGIATAVAAPATRRAAAQNPRVLRVGLQNLGTSIDPGGDFSNQGSQLFYNIFDSLVHKDHTKIEPVYEPGLAQSWRVVSETVLEMTLRQNVRFHDGTPVTAEDVQWSVHRLLERMFPLYVPMYRNFMTNLKEIQIVDAGTIRVHTHRPDPALYAVLATNQAAIVPKAYMQRVGFEQYGLRPIASGPYKVVSFVPGQSLELEAVGDHWSGRPPVDRVVMRRIPEMAARVTALLNNEVDIIANIPPDQVATIDRSQRHQTRGLLTPLFHVVIYNTKHPIMSDRKLRQAMSDAIDRKLLVDTLWEGRAAQARGHQLPQFGEFYDASRPFVRFDPERARRLLRESSYRGQTVRFDTSAFYYTNGFLAAQALKEMWDAVGIKVEINVTEPWTGDSPDMMARNWSNPMYYADPTGCYGTMWGPTGNRVPVIWDPPAEYNDVWARVRHSLDPAERRRAYAQILEIWENEAPGTILYQPIEYYGVRKDLAWQPLPGHVPYCLDFRAGKLRMPGA